MILPAGWLGFAACELIRRTYKILAASSADYICRSLQNAEGPMPAAGRSFHRRFNTPA